MTGHRTSDRVAQAFIDGKRLILGHYRSIGKEFILFGNVIAEKCEGGFYIKDCGWCTLTTSYALNALPGVRLRRLHGEWIWNEKRKWDGKDLFVEYKS